MNAFASFTEAQGEATISALSPETELGLPYPSPFNTTVTVPYAIGVATHVQIISLQHLGTTGRYTREYILTCPPRMFPVLQLGYGT